MGLTENGKTKTWLKFASFCKYITKKEYDILFKKLERLLCSSYL
ncbi:MAG: hypothetical protein H7096_12255 [Flavobacterium sp.]|nr:hypothetical protein [Pedobacter sp.]